MHLKTCMLHTAATHFFCRLFEPAEGLGMALRFVLGSAFGLAVLPFPSRVLDANGNPNPMALLGSCAL